MTGAQRVFALQLTAQRIAWRHGRPPLLGRPANDNWVFEEDGA